MKKITFLSALVGIIMLFALNANAMTINGVATANNDTNDLAVVNPAVTKIGNKYEYFIPLGESDSSEASPAVNIDGVYGVTDVNGGTANYGTFSDKIKLTTAEQIDGPTLDMYFYFNVAAGQQGTSVTIWNDDLDLALSNDPTGFFEKIQLYGQWGMPTDTFTTWAAISAAGATVNPGVPGTSDDMVGITFSGLNVASGDNWLKLSFSSYSSGFGAGTWYNTPELISVSMETNPVPEPATIALLGIGIVGLAGAAARKKRRKSQNK